MSGITFSAAPPTQLWTPSPPPPPPSLPFHPLVHMWSSRCRDYGPSHAWHSSMCLRYIIILVENDVMHFKMFVLRTPSVPAQMMSLALCLAAEKLSSRFGEGEWEFAWRCRHLVVEDQHEVLFEGKRRVEWIVGNYLLPVWRIMRLIMDVLGAAVLMWSAGSGTDTKRQTLRTWLDYKLGLDCLVSIAKEYERQWQQINHPDNQTGQLSYWKKKI